MERERQDTQDENEGNKLARAQERESRERRHGTKKDELTHKQTEE